MPIERRFQVDYHTGTRKWNVVACGPGGLRLPICEGREEIFAETMASRLNEAYTDSLDEVKYLLDATKSA